MVIRLERTFSLTRVLIAMLEVSCFSIRSIARTLHINTGPCRSPWSLKPLYRKTDTTIQSLTRLKSYTSPIFTSEISKNEGWSHADPTCKWFLTLTWFSLPQPPCTWPLALAWAAFLAFLAPLCLRLPPHPWLTTLTAACRWSLAGFRPERITMVNGPTLCLTGWRVDSSAVGNNSRATTPAVAARAAPFWVELLDARPWMSVPISALGSAPSTSRETAAQTARDRALTSRRVRLWLWVPHPCSLCRSTANKWLRAIRLSWCGAAQHIGFTALRPTQIVKKKDSSNRLTQPGKWVNIDRSLRYREDDIYLVS